MDHLHLVIGLKEFQPHYLNYYKQIFHQGLCIMDSLSFSKIKLVSMKTVLGLMATIRVR